MADCTDGKATKDGKNNNVTTYHEMYRVQLGLLKNLMSASDEILDSMRADKKKALMNSDVERLNIMKEVEDRANKESEVMTKRIRELMELAKKKDQSKIPTLSSYGLLGDDDVSLIFNYGDGLTCEVETSVTDIYHRCCNVKYIEDLHLRSGIEFVIGFRGSTVVKFLTVDEFLKERKSFIGIKCLSMNGEVGSTPIKSIGLNDKTLGINIGDSMVLIDGPVAVAPDNGAIWVSDEENVFKWLWFKKG